MPATLLKLLCKAILEQYLYQFLWILSIYNYIELY